MASGGSSGRGGSGSRSFDFGSDDVLCSYEDYAAARDASNGKRPDPSSGKDLHESRMARPLVNIYEQEEYSKEDMISAVEKCMKKYADNLLRYLEGISGRLSQLESHCYKLERSIGEYRSDIIRDQSATDMKFKTLEKHVQEVHRSVQILRDKQELAETQKELAKLQLVQKESAASSHLQMNEEGVATSVAEPKKHDDKSGTANNQLALALPQPTTAQMSLAAPPMHHAIPASLNMQQDRYVLNQAGTYYSQHQTMPQGQQSQAVQPDPQYVQPRPQMQDLSVQAPPQQPQMVNQTQPQTFPQYPQQWPQQPPQQYQQQVVQPHQPASRAQLSRPQAPPPSYPPYPLSHPTNPVPETFPSSMAMQVPYNTISQPGGSRAETVAFSYGGPGNTAPQLPSQQNLQQQPQVPASQGSFGQPSNKVGYLGPSPYTLPSNVQGYSASYNYPPGNMSAVQNQQLPPGHHPGQQLMRNHPYAEIIEKAVSFGYARDQVVSVIHRMAESGQPMDFNTLLDRLNGPNAAASPRVWSG